MSNDQHIEAGEGAHLENILQAQTAINPILAAAGAQVFVGGYEQLRYINPKTVYKRVRTDRFVGREWLLARVDEFLKRRSGYFKIEAKAGLGKTSFLAHLARTRGYIHLFAEQAPGREGVGRGLESLCAQLVTRFELGPAVLSTGAGRPDFLETLLHEAAEKNAGGDGDPIVLVVDALDEAGAPEGLNVLGLPRRLPDGVFIIVTQRPVAVRLETDQAPVVVEIDGDAPDNRRDMRRFLERVAGEPKFAERLASAGVRTDVFIETLLARCHGEWIYLYYIIDEIEGGQRTILPLEHLPHGVWQYYASYWERWRAQHEDPWPSFDLPVLSTLAAAPTELSPKALAEFAGVGQKEEAVRERLEGVWRPFVVAVPGDDRVRRYRLYHRSLRDCFEGKADPEHLTSHEKRLLEHLAEGVREAHGRISRWICQAWGGLEKGLPRLQDGSADPEMTRYGVLHLAGHLEGARSVQELHTLLALEPSKSWSARVATLVRAKFSDPHASAEPLWFTAHQRMGDISTYTADVERAARVSGQDWAKRVRYLLVSASIISLANKVSPELLGLLLKHGIWSERRALAYARQGWGGRESLLACLPYVSSGEVRRIVDFELRNIGWFVPEDRSCLVRLLPFMNDADVGHCAERLAREGKSARDEMLPVLASRLSPTSGSILIEAAFRDESWTWPALTMLGPFLSEERRALVRDHLAAAPIDERVVVSAAPHLPRDILASHVRALLAQRSQELIKAGAQDFKLLLGSLQPAELEEQLQTLWKECSEASSDRDGGPLLGLRLAGLVCPEQVQSWVPWVEAEQLLYEEKHRRLEILMDHDLHSLALSLAFGAYEMDASREVVARRADRVLAERGVVLASSAERGEAFAWTEYRREAAERRALPFWIRLAELGQFENARAALRRCRNADVRSRLALGIAPWAPASVAREFTEETLRLSAFSKDAGAVDAAKVSLAGQLVRFGTRTLAAASWLKLAEQLPRVPEASRSEVWRSIFKAVSKLGDDRQRIDGYARLLATSSGAQFDAVHEVFLEEWRRREVYESTRCAAVTYLPEPDATDILQRELARSFLTFDDKIDALMENPEWLTAHAAVIWNAAIRSSLGEDAFELLIAGLQLDDVRKGLLEFADSPRFALLVGRLAQLGHPSEAVCAARSKEGKVRDASLARLAQHLASDEIEQLWSVCRSDDSYGHDIVLWLLPWLPDAERAGAVDLAFKRASGYALRRGIRKLADLDVERTVDAAVRGLPFDRVKALRALMAIIPSDHVSAQRRVLDGALQHVYTQSRSSALEIVAELAPYIANLGGADAVRETLRAIDDVTRWWP